MRESGAIIAFVVDHGDFRSKALDSGTRFAFTCGTAGEFPCFCGQHPRIKGKIVVAP